jgi:hypothetical protein
LLSFVICLEANGTEEQFGSQPGRGTIDALYTLRSALQLRREHQTDSYVLFIDLIKAFDTANHPLLFRLLGKYGAPPELVAVIEKLHENFHLKLEIEKESCEIPYTVGVKQGDNMAPTLFLFLMMAFFSTLEKKMGNINGQNYPRIQISEQEKHRMPLATTTTNPHERTKLLVFLVHVRRRLCLPS